jgi:hypothetical protein
MRASRAGLLLFTFAMAAAAFLSAPQRTMACACLAGAFTRNYTGSGSSCGAANTSVFDQADTEASNDCAASGDSVCFESSVIVTVACAQHGTTWTETGHIRYKCAVCP